MRRPGPWVIIGLSSRLPAERRGDMRGDMRGDIRGDMRGDMRGDAPLETDIAEKAVRAWVRGEALGEAIGEAIGDGHHVHGIHLWSVARSASRVRGAERMSCAAEGKSPGVSVASVVRLERLEMPTG